MAKVTTTCDINNLAGEIVLAVKEYTEDVSKAVEKEVTDTAKAVLKDIKADSPVDTGNYKKGWTRKKKSKGGQIEYTIYNKTNPYLVHLLEKGHAKVNGGRVAGIPHVAINYDKHVPKMEANIKKIIKNGGG